MSSIEIGISFYVLPVIFNLLPKSLCYNFNGRFFDLYEVSEGYFNSPGVVPRCFGIWRALGAYPWLSFDHKNNQHPWLSFDHQSNRLQEYHLMTKTINVVKMETCRGSCIGTFWHRRIRRASTIYQAETIIIPMMIKTTMMMMKFNVDDEVWDDDWYEGSWLKNITLSRRLFNV